MNTIQSKTESKFLSFVRKVAYFILGVGLLLIAIIVYLSKNEPSAVPKMAINTPVEAPKTVNVGETGIIRTGIPGAINEDAYDAMIKASTTKDNEGFAQLVEAGQAIIVDNNTKVRVIEPGVFKKRVRLLSGDHKGAAVWVPTEYVESE